MGLLDFLAKRARAQAALKPHIDPAVFNDPLALKTEWTPLVPGGANFKTHVLGEGAQGRLEFRPSTGLVLFGLAFLVVGVGTGVALILVGSAWALFGLPFTGIGLYVLLVRPAKQFDPQQRQAVIGKRTIPFSTIVGVQVVRELIEGSEEADYSSYELNLVLADGSRVNVIDHGNAHAVKSDAVAVASCIGCKLWDASAV